MINTDLIERLRKRAEIRRQIPSRRSVQAGEPDRISSLLEEAADRLESLELEISILEEQACSSLDGAY
jgi:Trm5-related predicted tRNA methylase